MGNVHRKKGRKGRVARKTGRACTFEKEKGDRIIELIQTGCYLETAAAAAGVVKQTFYNWLRAGARGQSPELVSFVDSVRKAAATLEAGLVGNIALAGSKPQTWAANAWLLERKFPKKWGARIRVHVEEELGAALDKLEQRLPPDQYAAVLEALSSEDGTGPASEASGLGPDGFDAALLAGVDSETDAEVQGATASEPIP